MGDLNLQGSVIGMSQSGMDSVRTKIKTNLIGETRTTLAGNITSVINNVGNYWQGAAADAFKEHMQKEHDAIVEALDELESAMDSSIDAMQANFTNSDQTLAQGIANN